MTYITPAHIHFNETGTPVSEAFDDIYYSKDNGLVESNYVFIEGNHLPQRWSTHISSRFVIAETGFGTGLNFLTVCHAFMQFVKQVPSASTNHLHFISFEKYPLTVKDLEQSLQQWTSVSPWAEALIKHYPSLVTGCHRILINDNITLDLWFGDILDTLPTVSDRQTGIVDAWFLDGFAPSKNPDMWQATLFEHMVRLSKSQATLATFTAAGFVRRGLADAGFNMKKRKGFAHKREMLVGTLTSKSTLAVPKIDLLYPAPANKQKANNDQPLNKQLSVAIIGGGIAGICTAQRLISRGYHVSLFTEGHLANQASGNHQGALYPLLQLQHNPITELHLKSFEFSYRFYTDLKNDFDFGYETCGVLQLAFNDDRKRRLQQLKTEQTWPPTLVEVFDKEQSNQTSNMTINQPAWFYPKGGWLNPVSFTQSLAKNLLLNPSFSLHENASVQSIDNDETSACWTLNFANTPSKKTDIVIIASGISSKQFSDVSPIEMTPVRGQVSHLNSTGKLHDLSTVICHKGYLTPQWKNLHCAGASFLKGNNSTETTHEEDEANLAQQTAFLPHCDIDFNKAIHVSSRASIRATTQDHMPIMGALFNAKKLKESHHDLWKGLPVKQPTNTIENLYCITGLGSRGLSTAPYLAELLASIIDNNPLPITSKIQEALHPNRFLIKRLIRRTE